MDGGICHFACRYDVGIVAVKLQRQPERFKFCRPSLNRSSERQNFLDCMQSHWWFLDPRQVIFRMRLLGLTTLTQLKHCKRVSAFRKCLGGCGSALCRVSLGLRCGSATNGLDVRVVRDESVANAKTTLCRRAVLE